jgi:hypothetical protein
MFVVELQSEGKAKHVPVVLQIWCLVLLKDLQVCVSVSHGPVLVCKHLRKTVIEIWLIYLPEIGLSFSFALRKGKREVNGK